MDFTKSNSLNKQDLHKMKPDAGGGSSMYETAMRCIARTLHHLDELSRSAYAPGRHP